MKVLGLNKNREVVEKELTVTEEHGAVLTYKDTSICIEPNIKFFDKIYKPWEGPNGFMCSFVMTTSKCNKKCDYCYEQKMKVRHYGDPTADELISIMKDFIPVDDRGYGTKPYKDYKYDGFHPVLRLIGGEPTVFDGLSKYLHWLCENRDHKIMIYTNGIKMLNKKFFDDLPKSSKIVWCLSIDWNTPDDFIKKWADNVMNCGGDNEIAASILINDKDWKIGIHHDEIIRKYPTQEIRYRGMSEQDGSKISTASDVLNFITEARGIKAETFINKAKWYQQILTCLSYKDTENPETGNIVAARLPVWNTALIEELSKSASFTINTKSFWNPTEGHCASVPLFIYRMKNPQKYYHEAHKLFWGKQNPYTRKGK